MSPRRAGSFDSLATSLADDDDDAQPTTFSSAADPSSPAAASRTADGDGDADEDDDDGGGRRRLNAGDGRRINAGDERRMSVEYADEDDADADHDPDPGDEEEDDDDDGDGGDDDDDDDDDEEDEDEDGNQNGADEAEDEEDPDRPRPSAAARLAAAKAIAASTSPLPPQPAPPRRPPPARPPPPPSQPTAQRPRPARAPAGGGHVGAAPGAHTGIGPELWKKAKSTKSGPLRDALERIVVQAGRKDVYSFFAEPVDVEAVPMYRQIITHPMDFGTIRTRIQQDHYTSVADFEQDLMLVFHNAMTFNPPDTPYHQSADRLARWAERAIPRETQYAITPAEQQILDGGRHQQQTLNDGGGLRLNLADFAPGAAALAAAQAESNEALPSDEDADDDDDDDGMPPSSRAAAPAPSNAHAIKKSRRSYRPRQSGAARPVVHHTHPVPLQFLPDGSIDPLCAADVALIPHAAAQLGSHLVEAQQHPPTTVCGALVGAGRAAKTIPPRIRSVQAVPIENLAEVPSGTGSSARTMALQPPPTGYKTPSDEPVDVRTHFTIVTSSQPTSLVDTEWPPLRPDARGTQPAPSKARRKGSLPVHLPTRVAGPVDQSSRELASQWGLLSEPTEKGGAGPSIPPPLRWPAVDPSAIALGRKTGSPLTWPLSWAAVTAQPSRQLSVHDVGLGSTSIPSAGIATKGILPGPNQLRNQPLRESLTAQLGSTESVKRAFALPTSSNNNTPEVRKERPSLSLARRDPRKTQEHLHHARSYKRGQEASIWTTALAPAVPTDLTHSMWTNMYRSYRPAVANVVKAGENASESLRDGVYGGIQGQAYLSSIARFVHSAAQGVRERWGKAPEAEWDVWGQAMMVSSGGEQSRDSQENGPRPIPLPRAAVASLSSGRKRPRSESEESERCKRLRTTAPYLSSVKAEDQSSYKVSDFELEAQRASLDPHLLEGTPSQQEEGEYKPSLSPFPLSQAPEQQPLFASSLGVPLVTYVRDKVAEPLTQGCLSILDELAAGFSLLPPPPPTPNHETGLESGGPDTSKPAVPRETVLDPVPPHKAAHRALSRAGVEVTGAAIARDQEEAAYWTQLSQELDEVDLGPTPPPPQAAGMARTPSTPGAAPLGLVTATALAASYTDPGLRMRRDELSRLLGTRMDVGELLRGNEELNPSHPSNFRKVSTGAGGTGAAGSVEPTTVVGADRAVGTAGTAGTAGTTTTSALELPVIKGLPTPVPFPPRPQAELSTPLTGGGLDRISAAVALDAAAHVMVDLGARRPPVEANRSAWLDQVRRALLQVSVWGSPAADTRAPISHEVVRRVQVNPVVRKEMEAFLAQQSGTGPPKRTN